MYDPYFSYASESLLYIAVLVVAVIGMIASLKVQSTFKKYSTMPARLRPQGERRCAQAALRGRQLRHAFARVRFAYRPLRSNKERRWAERERV